jgi:hypothetical protein
VIIIALYKQRYIVCIPFSGMTKTAIYVVRVGQLERRAEAYGSSLRIDLMLIDSMRSKSHSDAHIRSRFGIPYFLSPLLKGDHKTQDLKNSDERRRC